MTVSLFIVATVTIILLLLFNENVRSLLRKRIEPKKLDLTKYRRLRECPAEPGKEIYWNRAYKTLTENWTDNVKVSDKTVWRRQPAKENDKSFNDLKWLWSNFISGHLPKVLGFEIDAKFDSIVDIRSIYSL